jgi:hypothetical protein
VELSRILDAAPLTDPLLVVGLDGWVNAGDAATTVAEVLADDGPVVAEFDSDALFDFRATRPTLTFDQGVFRDISYPALELRRRSTPQRDLLLLSGAEPNWNWHRLASDVVEIAQTFGVVGYVSVGGIPWAAPHTRPVAIITTSTDPGALLPGEERPEGTIQVPGSATSAIEYAAAGAGIPTYGFWARVPHYLGTPFQAAALALVERLDTRFGLGLDLTDMAARAAEQRVEIDAVAQARPEVQAMVERLEAMVDDHPPVSGEELASEIERFLRDRGGETFGGGG